MEPIPESLREFAEARMRERGTTGVAVAVFDRDGVRFAGGIGLANRARSEDVAADTIFRIASVSKLLTTTVVLRAMEQGLLGLDDLINDHLPTSLQIRDASGELSDAPIRSLLSHTSGLPSSLRGVELGGRVQNRLANGVPAHDLASSISGLRTIRPHGKRVLYANSGFNVAGYLAGQAFGREFEDAALDEVFGPLGMSATRFGTGRTGPGVATPYGSLLPPRVSEQPADVMQLVATPMGGATTSVLDLARFGQMVLSSGVQEGQQFLDGSTLAMAFGAEARNHPDLEQFYGLGFKVRPWRGRRLVGHDGNMPGVASQFIVAPDDGVGVVVLTNGFSLAVPHAIALEALDRTLDDVDGEDPEGSGTTSVRIAARSDDSTAAIALAERLQGRYRVDGMMPPGAAGTLADAATRIDAVALGDGSVRISGNPGADGVMVLRPDGPVGHFRVQSPVDNGTDAIVVDGDDGPLIWVGFATLLVPKTGLLAGRRSHAPATR